MGFGFGGIAEVFAVQDFHRALRAHDGDLGGRPGIVDVAAQMFGGHDAIGAAIGFAGNDGDFGHGRFAVGVEQFRAVFDHAAIFLIRAGQEAGDVDQR